MPICPQCNKELSEGTQFCDSCGTKIVETIFCTSCGQQTSTEYSFCQFCGASLAEEAAPEQPVETSKPKFQLPKKAVLFGAIGVAVIAVIILIVSLLAGGKGQQNYALYLKDMELYYNALGKNSESWQVSNKLVSDSDTEESDLAGSGYSMGYLTRMSSNGKYIFYPDKVGEDGYTLYYRAVSDTEGKGNKIDSGVSGSYLINEAGTLVTYGKNKDDSTDLYQYDVKKDSKDKIASDVDFAIPAENGDVIYLNSEGNLYLKPVGKDKEKIASDVTSMDYISEDFKIVYYTKDDVLYKHVIGKDKEKIASDVASVVKIYESGEIYYLSAAEDEVSLADYVDDDLASSDAAMTQPSSPIYPNYPNYPTYPSSPDYPYWWEYDTDAQYDAAYAAYEKAYKEWQDKCNRMETDYYNALDEWEEECDRIDEEYYAARDAYWAKEDRDAMRASLKETTLSESVYTLYYYNGKDSTILTEAFAGEYYACEVAADAAVIVYEVYNQEDVKKVKISEVTGIYELETMVEEALNSAKEHVVAVKDAVTPIETEEDATNFVINDPGTLIYYMAELDEDNHGEMYCISVKKGVPGEAEPYDSDVYVYSRYFLDDERLLYFKDGELDEETYNRTGEMYINKEQIDEDVMLYSVKSNDDMSVLWYFVDWDEEDQCGTLKLYDGKKAKEIAEDAHEACILPDGRLLYLIDYSTKHYNGELHEWNNGKTRKIDEDVIAIVPIISIDNRGVYGW